MSMPFLGWLKWFSIVWTVCAIALVVILDVVIANGWFPIVATLPFDVSNSTQVALLLTPGAVVAAIHWYLEKHKAGSDKSKVPGSN